MLTKEQRLDHIERNLRLLNDTGGTDKDWMLKVIREQDVALAEARQIIEVFAGMHASKRATTWLIAHPAPAKDP